MLTYLVENSDRLITKDELVEKIWDGRFITDAAISTVVKTVRKALGDDGNTQKYVRTVHGRGFRFVGKLEYGSARTAEIQPQTVEAVEATHGGPGERPSIAVLPFKLIGSSDGYDAIADAVPSELISTLSRLRWLKVIARGTTFRFRDIEMDLDFLRDQVGASYLLTGDVELFGPSLAITVDLSDTRSGQVVWGDRLSGKIDDVHQMRDDVVRLVISALELHIPQNEAALARIRPPESLDAWSCYHLGLQHMYRFNKADNASAAAYFHRAAALDPNFARAYAAQSFTSFQAAFLRYGSDRSSNIEDARRYAEKSVELDPMDPFGNFNFGRAHWLRGDPAAGQAWLERSMSLSPSFAQGFYAHGWAEVMGGQGATALESLSAAVSLSPLDPFLYAMQSATGLAYLHTDDLGMAAYWADQGARKPGAHYLIAAIAASINELAGNGDAATYWTEQAFARRPDASVEQFFAAFPFTDQAVSTNLRSSLLKLGFPEK